MASSMIIDSPKLSILHTQTLSHSHHVRAMDMRLTNDGTTAILLTGDENGCVWIYRAPMGVHIPRVHFVLCQRYLAHMDFINMVHLHPKRAVFISAADDNCIKVWNIHNLTAPHLITRIPHPDWVFCNKYSPSGLLLTGCWDDMLRVFDPQQKYALRWSFKASSNIYSIAWSPSNCIAASFYSHTDAACVVQVWDSSFRPLFRQSHRNSMVGYYGLAFIANDLLLSSDWNSKTLYWLMSRHKLMSLIGKVVPFCRDVIQMILKFLPLIRSDPYPKATGAVLALNSQLVAASCRDASLRIYRLRNDLPHLLASFSHKYCEMLASCAYAGHGHGQHTGFVIATAWCMSHDVKICVTSSKV